MFIPLYVDYTETKGHNPWPLLLVMAANVVVFAFLELYLAKENPEFAKALFDWAAREDSGIGHLVVGKFLHESWVYLLFNLWFLWMFGMPVVQGISAVHFFVLYLAAGALGTFVQDIVTVGGSIGASASVAGVMGFCLVRHASAKVYCLGMVSLSHRNMAHAEQPIIPAWAVICFFIIADIFIAMIFNDGSVAAIAHLSGSAVGVLSGLSASWHDKRINQQTNKRRRPGF